ncbi:unannotated protein [freshwater metagenome]|uniref:Unannotated protein n=1 Tax=freshwater metagenome TaxID=449393 RepID=A0A6J7CWU3_9ZZZZ|nr:hypothetical protein [Actinomycetota bacterium]
MFSARRAFRTAGACAAVVAVGGVSTILGVAKGSFAAPQQAETNDHDERPIAPDRHSHLETCAPDLGGVKVPYEFNGFFKPVSMDSLKNVEAGRKVPLKFRVIDTTDNCVISNLAAVGAVTLNEVACPGEPDAAPLPVPFEGSQVRFDKHDQQFVREWTVPAKRRTCYDISQSVWTEPASTTAHFRAK